CLSRSRNWPRQSLPTPRLCLWLCRCRPCPRAPSGSAATGSRHTGSQQANPLPRNPIRPVGTPQESRRAAHPLRRNRSTMAVDHFYSGRICARVAAGDRPGYELLLGPLVLCLAVLFVCLSSGPFPLAAQGLGLGTVSEDRPIAISAASGI